MKPPTAHSFHPLPCLIFERKLIDQGMLLRQAVFLAIFLVQLPDSLHALVFPDKEGNISNFSYDDDDEYTFLINFSAPNIFVFATNKTANATDEVHRHQLEGSFEEFCGTWQRIGLAIFLVMIIVPIVSLALYVHLVRSKDEQLLGKALRCLPGMPKEFCFQELRRATRGFAEDNKIGEGAYAEVFKGVLPRDGEEVAVKKFKKDTGRGDFLAELTIISQLRHRNLVSLLATTGWCYKNERLVLIYTYMPHGSLHTHLYRKTDKAILSWEQRYRILAGLAFALRYLQKDYNQKVVHRDIKPSNIMLDSNFNACLGDFGLAQAINNKDEEINEEILRVPGTRGYIAPELILTGKATRKSDVYSFGVVMLEVVCGRPPCTPIDDDSTLLLDWVWAKHEEGRLLETIDSSLGLDYDADDARRLLLLGLACCHPDAYTRPKAQAIIDVISKSSPPPLVPLPMPSFSMQTSRKRKIEPIVTEGDLYSNFITYSSRTHQTVN